MYIDTHCHLTFEQFKEDRAMVIGNAKKAGVKKFICPAVDPLSCRLAIELAQKNPGVVFAAVGYHPYEASHGPSIADLENMLKSSKLLTTNYSPPTTPVVAIGECGLDYHLYKGEVAAGKKQEQKILFEEHLRLALRYDLPLIMHCRDAYDDFFDVFDSMPTAPRGVIHCFSGGLMDLRLAQKRQLFVGIDGNVTYSKQLALIVPQIPLDMILLETDAPYLTPAPHRGTRNEPKYIPLIAKQIAFLQKTDVETVQTQTTLNASRLFRVI